MEKNDRIMLSAIEDKARQCGQQDMLTHTAFLSFDQVPAAERHCMGLGQRFLLFGGYEDAERRIVCFLPDYFDESDLYGEASPLCVLSVKLQKGAKPLSHRDYLGSLLALGVSRGVAGDILVRPGGADIIILKEMEDFLLSSYVSAGRNSLSCAIAPLSSLKSAEINTKDQSGTLASLRLDNGVSEVFRLSRSAAQDAIRMGLVSLNGRQCLKPDAPIEENDRIVLRGKGKAVLSEIGNKTRKDRIFVTFTVYQ